MLAASPFQWLFGAGALVAGALLFLFATRVSVRPRGAGPTPLGPGDTRS